MKYPAGKESISPAPWEKEKSSSKRGEYVKQQEDITNFPMISGDSRGFNAS